MRDEIKEFYEDILSDLGDLSAKITVLNGDEFSVIAPSLAFLRSTSDQGESETPDAVIRIDYDNLVLSGIKILDIVTLIDAFSVESRLRIREISNTGGIVRLLCEAVYA